MKILQLVIASLFLFTLVSAQTADDTFNTIAAAIEKSDDVALTKHFNSSIEITLSGSSDAVYTDAERGAAIKKFFKNNPAKSFKIIHKGSSGSANYCNGSYVSGNTTFDTNIFIKQDGAKFVITQIRFESE